MLAQPLRWTVTEVWPVRRGPKRLGTDSSSRICIGDKYSFSVFQNLNCQFTAYRRKIPKEDFERVPCFEMLEQDTNRYPGAYEDRGATKDFGVRDDAK